ncbi:MAG TPA: lysophospholipid acyltransferase family protein [Chthoniobacterales bacterium]|nr:lysophospholipid acyltransferase family protein [Chthoniobacterales bacterium]
MQTQSVATPGVSPHLESASEDLPVASPILLAWFTWYSRRYLRRHFHSLRVSRAGLPPRDSNAPLVIFVNHASWWDPLLWIVLKAEFFPARRAFAPIDSMALARYKILSRLGFFGVEQKTGRGAIQFLRTAEKILRVPGQILALTPQGRIADSRERPVRFEPGLGYLATRAGNAVFLPVASEFVFWEERLPEILVRFGAPIRTEQIGDAESATLFFEHELEAVQDALAMEVKRRDPDDFQMIMRGGAGQGGVYDWYRATKAKILRETFLREHGAR